MLNALENLLAVYRRALACWTPPQRLHFDDDEAQAREWKRKLAVNRLRLASDLTAARKGLIRSGFSVPDNWLSANAAPRLQTGLDGADGLFVAYDGVDAAGLETVCGEIEVAILRLQAAPGNPPADDPAAATRLPAAPRVNVNARMLELVQRELNLVAGWTAAEWAKKLHCSSSTVTGTSTWKDLATSRNRQRAEQALGTDRRRRSKGA